MSFSSIIWWIALIVIVIIVIYILYSIPRTCYGYLCSSLGISSSRLIWGILGVILFIAFIILIAYAPEDYKAKISNDAQNYIKSLSNQENSGNYLNNNSQYSDKSNYWETNDDTFDSQYSEDPMDDWSFSDDRTSDNRLTSYNFNPLYDPYKARAPYTVKILNKNLENISAGEKACRYAAEKIFGKPFPSVHISWLKNPKTKRSLEIDCYNDDLKIGIEYHGEQHYKKDHYFHRRNNKSSKRDDSYERSVERDEAKLDLCDTYGVYLITIPYKTSLSEIENLIRYYMPQKRLKRLQQGLTE